jgi:hypothetical protein
MLLVVIGFLLIVLMDKFALAVFLVQVVVQHQLLPRVQNVRMEPQEQIMEIKDVQ